MGFEELVARLAGQGEGAVEAGEGRVEMVLLPVHLREVEEGIDHVAGLPEGLELAVGLLVPAAGLLGPLRLAAEIAQGEESLGRAFGVASLAAQAEGLL